VKFNDRTLATVFVLSNHYVPLWLWHLTSKLVLSLHRTAIDSISYQQGTPQK